MTTSIHTGGGGPDDLGGGTGSEGVKEQAQQTASTAADEGKRVAGVAAHEASTVVDEARSQIRSLMGQAGQEVDAQSRQQKDRLAGTMRTFSEDLEHMASQGQGGLAGQLAREVADRARSLSTHLEQREPRDLLDDVRDFARRKPGTFLLGALAAGVVAGRLARGTKDAQGGAGTEVHGTAAPALTPSPAPVTTVGDPRFDPAEPGGRI